MRVHLSALNSGDPDSLMGQYAATSLCIRDGRLAGEGHTAIRNILHQEQGAGDVVGQMVQLNGEPTIVQWTGPEGHRHPTGVLHVKMAGDRVREIHIDHREVALRRIGAVNF